MAQKTIEVINLGAMADLDPDEQDAVAENAAALVGKTFGSAGSPLYQQLDYLTLDDPSGDGAVSSNDYGWSPEDVIFDGIASGLDSVIDYQVDLVFNDGSTAAAEILLLQDMSGRTFLAPFLVGSAKNDVLNDGGIRSMTFTGIVNDAGTHAYVDREADAFVVCFLEGTRIRAAAGEVPVERLSVGDLVETLDHGFQPLIWLGQETVSAGRRTSPIRLREKALGAGFPERDLYLSPQHRVLFDSPIAGRMFGTDQVFVPATKMIDLPGITQPVVQARHHYWHLMLKRHEILFAEGAPVESFLPGPIALAGLSPENRASLRKRLPFLMQGQPAPSAARPCISGAAAANLVRRHRRNKRPPLANPAAWEASPCMLWDRA